MPRVLTADAAPTGRGDAGRTAIRSQPQNLRRNPQREAAEAQEQRQMLALQLDGHNDIIYIVPAKTAIDLTA